MAILMAAIVMSHYTHQNLSLVTQINMQQTLRAVAFMAGKSLFLLFIIIIMPYNFSLFEGDEKEEV